MSHRILARIGIGDDDGFDCVDCVVVVVVCGVGKSSWLSTSSRTARTKQAQKLTAYTPVSNPVQFVRKIR